MGQASSPRDRLCRELLQELLVRDEAGRRRSSSNRRAPGVLSVGRGVSDVHCNFIINKATPGPAMSLTPAAELKERVYQMFSVRLEEVIYLRAALMP
jgi:hypothetical protein